MFPRDKHMIWHIQVSTLSTRALQRLFDTFQPLLMKLSLFFATTLLVLKFAVASEPTSSLTDSIVPTDQTEQAADHLAGIGPSGLTVLVLMECLWRGDFGTFMIYHRSAPELIENMSTFDFCLLSSVVAKMVMQSVPGSF